MDVRQLSAIVAIADHGTFSAAARALFTVQSNVSGHISRLEKELGVLLVDRAQGGLTEDGFRVVERARRVLNEIEDITSDMTSRHDKVAGQTRIGVIGTTARWLTPSLLRQLAGDHPDVRAIVREGASSSLVPNVMSGELNAAVIHLPIDEPELLVEPLFAEDLFLLVNDQHRLAAAETVAIAELDDEPLLLPPTGSALRKVLDRSAAANNVSLRPQAEIDGVRLLASLAIDGFGATIVPATAVPTWLTGAFRRINVPELPRRVVASVRRRRPATNAPTQVTLKTLSRVILEQGELQPGVHPETGALPVPRSG
ncbi:MAG: LysR family transcriptional regulator [Ilumatobacter sp.]|nr:LysR family transcriptional regulator [bacterium]MDG1267604.1 LysR family transcriptional regulator [Ilumatobacter sp.]